MDNHVTKMRAAFERASAAHLVVDVQKAYCEPDYVRTTFQYYPLLKQYLLEVPPRIAEFSDRTRATMMQAWVTWHDMEKDASPARPLTRETIMDTLWQQPARVSDLLLTKGHMDAFNDGILNVLLKDRGIDTLILTGVFMDQCVHATAMGGKAAGYDVYVVKNLTVPVRYSQETRAGDLAKEGMRSVTEQDVLRAARL